MAFHRNPKAWGWVFVWAVLALGMHAAEAPLPPAVQHRLELLKTSYETFVLKTVTTPFKEGFLQLNAMAATALKRENTAAAQIKDLDTLVRIKADLERIGKGQVLTAPDALPPPARITAIYAAYRLEYERLQAEQKLNFADAKKRYDLGMAAVQDELTTQQNLDAALHVKHLRETLAGAEAGAATAGTATAASTDAAGSGTRPMTGEWTYHLRDTMGRSGTMVFEPDGTFMLLFTNMAGQQHGTWKPTAKPGVVSMTYTDVKVAGTDPIELKVTGDKAQMDVPNVGTRYLHARPPEDGTGIAGQWTYHLAKNGEASGLMTLHPDGRLRVKMKLDKEPQLGWWTDTDQPGVIKIAYDNASKAGPAPWEVRFSGTAGEMDLPNVGKRYLKFQRGISWVPLKPEADKVTRVDGLPAEWTSHTAADVPSTGWLRLLPQDVMEWHDRKGVQTGTWHRTPDGFDVECLGETWTVQLHNDWAEVKRPGKGPDYLRLMAPVAAE